MQGTSNSSNPKSTEEGSELKPSSLDATSDPYRQAILDHYHSHFGDSADVVLCDRRRTRFHIDCYIFPATIDRGFITLATVGMSSYQMTPPEGSEKCDRAEVLMYLDADWDFDAPMGMYPALLLQNLARFPLENDTQISWGHTVDSGGQSLLPGTLLTQTYVRRAPEPDVDFEAVQFPVGDHCHFLWHVPITEPELYLAVKSDRYELSRQLDAVGYHVLEVDRACLVLPEARADRRARLRAQSKRAKRPVERSVYQLDCQIHDARPDSS